MINQIILSFITFTLLPPFPPFKKGGAKTLSLFTLLKIYSKTTIYYFGSTFLKGGKGRKGEI